MKAFSTSNKFFLSSISYYIFNENFYLFVKNSINTEIQTSCDFPQFYLTNIQENTAFILHAYSLQILFNMSEVFFLLFITQKYMYILNVIYLLLWFLIFFLVLNTILLIFLHNLCYFLRKLHGVFRKKKMFFFSLSNVILQK